MTEPSTQTDASCGPRLVFFDVDGRRDLAQRAAAAAPAVRLRARHTWTHDPGDSRRPLLGRGHPRTGSWLWRGTQEQLAEQATTVLLQFVHPLVSRRLPYCLGFPFGPGIFAPRRLGLSDAAMLDLEDIGRLLGVGRPVTGDGPLAVGQPAAACPPPGGGDQRRGDDGQPPLDAAQRAAVEHAVGPARVLAPAGAGKTKTLIARVLQLIDRGADPSGVLMLAFNRKAAEQLEERLAACGVPTTRLLSQPGLQEPQGLLAPPPGAPPSPGSTQRPTGVHCATFNAFGYRYQRQVMGARVSLDHNGRELRALMRRAVETSGTSLADLHPARGSDPIGAFLVALTRVRAALEPPEQIGVPLECTGEQPIVTVPFADVHACYARAQAVTGLQSFDDQIYFAVADMLADPEHRAFIQGRFDHVLVDEFQDLNGAQLALVDVLSRPGRQLYVVGDDDQLIYGWRQADPRGILEFHRRMPPKPWSATYTLATNYRCSRAVVGSSARLVAHNTIREVKDVRPRAGAQEGALHFAGAPSWPGRAAAICAFLRAERSRLDCAWRDLAVLCRYRSQQFAVALALDGDGIPRTPTLGCRLFTHPAARLLRSYLDLVREPQAVAAGDLAYLLNRPNRYLTTAAVEAAGAASQPWAHVRAGAADEPAAGPRPLSTLVEQVDRLRAAFGLEPPSGPAPDPELPGASQAAPPAAPPAPGPTPPVSGAFIRAVATEFDLVEHWRREMEAAKAAGDPDGAGPFQVTDALSLLAEVHPHPESFLAAWDRLRRDEEIHSAAGDDSLAREESGDDRVVIGTIHAAKGREYQSVAIPDYACDVSSWSLPEIEEERRVVYVGVTRARDAVLFTVDTSVEFVQPFLRELVETPAADEHATLSAWLEETAGEEGAVEEGADLRRLVRDRIDEIELLFPELLPLADT